MVYYLIDLERSLISNCLIYWKKNRSGYTKHISEAGLYEEGFAEEEVKGDFDHRTIKISKKEVERILENK